MDYRKAFEDLYNEHKSVLVEDFPTVEDSLIGFKEGDKVAAFFRMNNMVHYISGREAVYNGKTIDSLVAGFTDFLQRHGLLDMFDPDDLAERVAEGVTDFKIRSDWAAAFATVEEGRELSNALGYGFNEQDLSNLAKLHRESGEALRTKIEDLLTDCNFHTECEAFIAGEYEAYIQKEDSPTL